MNQSGQSGKVGPIIAIPVIVTIALNIVGEHGIGQLTSGHAIILVAMSAFVAIVFLQMRRSSNKLRTIAIHAAATAAYGISIFLSDHHQSSGVTNYFSFEPAESFMIFMVIHTIISYLVLATTTLADHYGDQHRVPNTTHHVARSATNGVPADAETGVIRLNLTILVLLGLLETYLIPVAATSMGTEAGSIFGGATFLLLVVAFNVYLQAKHTGNWGQTRRIHGITGGIAFATLLVLTLSDNVGGDSFVDHFGSSLMFVSILYWLVSYTILCIVVYLKKHGRITR